MYRFGHRQVHHYLLYGAVGLLIVAGVIGVSLAVRNFFQPHTTITNAPAVIHTVTADQAAPQTITKSMFTMQLPAGWRSATAAQSRYKIYSWAGVGTYDAARRLDVYVDGVPPNLAFNRLLPVQTVGNQLEPIGPVSDNCVNFTDKTPASAASGQAPSKWGGVNFLCDTGNYERDVVAIGAAGTLNQVALKGAKTGAHHVLLVYTDNNIAPDYTIFVAIVKSFQLL